MQKFIFSIQVLGLLIAIPIYVILEMNHRLPENRNRPVAKQKVEKPIIQSFLNSDIRNENSRPGKILTDSTATVSMIEIIKPLAKADTNQINN